MPALLQVHERERVRFWKIETREFFNVRRDILARARRIGFSCLIMRRHTNGYPPDPPRRPRSTHLKNNVEL